MTEPPLLSPLLPPSLQEVRALQQQRFDEANRKAKEDAASTTPAASSRKRKAPSEDQESYTARLARIQNGKGGGNRQPLRDGSGGTGASCSLGKSRQSRQQRGG